MPSAFSASSACRGALLHRIGDGDDARELAVDGDEDRGRAVAAHPLGLCFERSRRDAELVAGTRRCRARRGGARPCRWRPCRRGESKPRTGASSILRSAAASTMARPSGCSLPRSTLAASRSISRSSPPVGDLAPRRPWACLRVKVPVLSTTSVSTASMRSSASAFLISTPSRAPRPTPTMIDIGVARPSAHGQAMISTVTAATRP